MPRKSQKKKNEQKADFQKKKLKLGQVSKADNYTDTSFTSKSIVVPNQSLVQDISSNDFRNSKNQTLKDLLIGLNHYASATRKDSIVGLKDLFARFPQAFHSSLTNQIIQSISKLFFDDESSVRKALLGFTQDFFKSISVEEIQPFISVIMAYVSSAMNHIFEDIRLDGLKFLDIFTLIYPSLICLYSEKIIPNFLSLLTTNHNHSLGKDKTLLKQSSTIVNPNSQIGLSDSRLSVLKSFHHFILELMKSNDSQYWYFEGYGVPNSFFNPDTSPTFKYDERIPSIPNPIKIIPFKSNIFQYQVTLHDKETTTIKNTKTKENSNKRIKINVQDITHSALKIKPTINHQYDFSKLSDLENFICILIPVLIDFWVETYPLAFGIGLIKLTNQFEIAETLIHILNLIWRSYSVLTNTTKTTGQMFKKFHKLLENHVTIHFPFGSGMNVSKDIKLENKLQKMNIYYSQTLLQFMAINQNETVITRQRISDFLSSLFVIPNQPKIKGELTKRNILIKKENLYVLFPTLWKCIETSNDKETQDIVTMLLDYFSCIPIKDDSKYIIFLFLSKLFQFTKHPCYNGPEFIKNEIVAFEIGKWIKMLFECCLALGTFKPEFKREMEEFISFAFRSNLVDSDEYSEFNKIQLNY